jgi:hypothetical protein
MVRWVFQSYLKRAVIISQEYTELIPSIQVYSASAITKCVEEGNFWEAYCYSASQKILAFYRQEHFITTIEP